MHAILASAGENQHLPDARYNLPRKALIGRRSWESPWLGSLAEISSLLWLLFSQGARKWFSIRR